MKKLFDESKIMSFVLVVELSHAIVHVHRMHRGVVMLLPYVYIVSINDIMSNIE